MYRREKKIKKGKNTRNKPNKPSAETRASFEVPKANRAKDFEKSSV